MGVNYADDNMLLTRKFTGFTDTYCVFLSMFTFPKSQS